MRSEWTAQRDREIEYGDGKKNDERWRTRCRERRWLGSDEEQRGGDCVAGRGEECGGILTETREVSEEILELIIRCRISVREFESVCAAMSKTLFPDGKGEGQCGSE